jgi:hypothetical protein
MQDDGFIERVRAPMALRVARGLFRVWLVLSVLWIAGVGVMEWRTFVYEYRDVDVCEELEAPAPGSCLPRSYADWVNPNSRARFRFALALAFVPPAFVLVLGSALVWAFRGFK